MNWKIEWMKTIPQAAGVKDVVVECGWRVTAEQDQHSASAYGSVVFSPPESADGGFTPFDQLTEAQVLSWVWSSGVDRKATEAAVRQQLDALINPPTIMAPLPWSNQ